MSLQTTTGPANYSRYERTGNNAIDLLAQSIGYHRAIFKPLETVYLSHGYWGLFVEGMRFLHSMKGLSMDHHSEFVFEGVNIRQGSRMQVDPMRYEYKKITRDN